MGKKTEKDSKKEDKKARKARKLAKKEAKELKKSKKLLKEEKKRLEKEARQKQQQSQSTTAVARADDDNDSTSRNQPTIASAPMTAPATFTTNTAITKKYKIPKPTKEKDEDLKSTVYYKKRLQVAISLLPAAMGNIPSALQSAVKLMLLKYTANVGILLSFGKLDISGGTGRVLDEIPHIHFKVAFDGLVFSPHIGCQVCRDVLLAVTYHYSRMVLYSSTLFFEITIIIAMSQLKGMVTESFPSHLGLLVLNYVNAMIPAEALHNAGYVFDHDKYIWVQEEESRIFEERDIIDFVVDKIHEVAGTISLEGSKPAEHAHYPAPPERALQ